MKRLCVALVLVASCLMALDFERESDYQNECDHNNGGACWQLGSMYHSGDGVLQSFSRAKELYLRACELGVGKGCSSLGYMYESGHAGTNYTKAAELYERGCVNGDAVGCENLAMMYENAKGMAEDMQKAVNYYDRACSSGQASSCAHLGLLYELEQNYDYAVVYYQNACDAGSAAECIRLGRMYYTGAGAKQSEERAVKLFQKACQMSESIGCKNYEAIKNSYYIE